MKEMFFFFCVYSFSYICLNRSRDCRWKALVREKDKGKEEKTCEIKKPVNKDSRKRECERKTSFFRDNICPCDFSDPCRQHIVNEKADHEGSKRIEEANPAPY